MLKFTTGLLNNGSLGVRSSLIPQSRSLFIQTQTTPNENALKFIPSDTKILPTRETPTLEINGIKEALHKSELAFKLLSINDKSIKSILFGYNFITIVKGSNYNWSILKPEIFSTLTEHLTSGQQVLNNKYMTQLIASEEAAALEEEEMGEYEDDDVVSLINELLVTRIQPAIQEDGGDIKFVRFDEDTGTVYLKLIGACKSCSSSEITLKNGIEEMLKFYIDEVKSVKQLLDEDLEGNVMDDATNVAQKIDELPPSL